MRRKRPDPAQGKGQAARKDRTPREWGEVALRSSYAGVNRVRFKGSLHRGRPLSASQSPWRDSPDVTSRCRGGGGRSIAIRGRVWRRARRAAGSGLRGSSVQEGRRLPVATAEGRTLSPEKTRFFCRICGWGTAALPQPYPYPERAETRESGARTARPPAPSPRNPAPKRPVLPLFIKMIDLIGITGHAFRCMDRRWLPHSRPATLRRPEKDPP